VVTGNPLLGGLNTHEKKDLIIRNPNTAFKGLVIIEPIERPQNPMMCIGDQKEEGGEIQ
jgi:hypothetical protein